MSLIRSVSGIRGIVRADDPAAITMSGQVARRMGQAYATYLLRSDLASGGSIFVGGRDGRASGDELLEAFIDGVRAGGLETVNLAIVSTPGIAMMVQRMGAVGGVVITASHNPSQWNGIKLMTADGQAPTKQAAERVFDIYDRGDFHVDGARPDKSDRATRAVVDPHDHHVTTVLGTVDAVRIRSRGFVVVLDSINGAGAVGGRMLLERLGCRVIHVNAEPAATFAHTPEPIAANLVELCGRVQSEGADVGFAQDPDADRLAIVDETGRFIGEEYTLVLCAKRVLATRPGAAAANLSTSRMIDDIAAEAGGACVVHRSAVGEANVVQVMKTRGCVFGGEGNGGVIDPRVVYVRDSFVAMALILDLLAAEEQTVSQAVGGVRSYAMIKDKITCDSAVIKSALSAVRERFSDGQVNDLDGVRIDWPAERKWIHVRGSNTEPIMRIIAEASDAESANALMQQTHQVVDALNPRETL